MRGRHSEAGAASGPRVRVVLRTFFPLRLDKSQGMQKGVPKRRPEAAIIRTAESSVAQAQDR